MILLDAACNAAVRCYDGSEFSTAGVFDPPAGHAVRRIVRINAGYGAGAEMDFALSAEQEAIGDAVARICARFGDDYWLAKDRDGGFPDDFHRAFADAGWLGVCIPQQYGGSGLGVTEAALMMQTIAASGAGLSGASALHMNIFGLNPVVVFGNDEQKQRMLPPLVAGRDKACFAVTEPDAGLDTLKLKTKAVRDGDRYIVSGQKIWISTAQVASKMLILARTTPLENVSRKTDGLSLFYTDLDRPGCREDADPGAHDAARPGQEAHPRAQPLLRDARPQSRRGARDRSGRPPSTPSRSRPRCAR